MGTVDNLSVTPEYCKLMKPLKTIGIATIAAAVVVASLREESGSPTHGGDPQEPVPAPRARTVYFTSTGSDMSVIPRWIDTVSGVQQQMRLFKLP